MSESNRDYLQLRAAEETERAQESQDRIAVAIHQRMAALYLDRVQAMSEHPEFDPIVETRRTT